jgi:transcriptional regulator with GAF, ATPase, and Fis domain/serine/threonine protein kinase/predicted negative regulator of RcsB-dependent stress response
VVLAIPPRYEAGKRLGAGGGGEVWSVRDRVTGEALAFKVLAENAGEGEVMALVREAMALSGLEGLGVPHVVAFGALAGSRRRYMVRELVEGESLEDILDTPHGAPWLEPLARASEQLTVLHRAGLLHGDIKPANVIVSDEGRATLVDLGLAAPWREGGTIPEGLTPRYAAPELFDGEALTVRAEVYALGATLADGLERRGAELDPGTRSALSKIAARATESAPNSRYPSVDELSSALRLAAGLAAKMFPEEAAWPVLGYDVAAEALLARVKELAPGEALAVLGPAGSGRTTLARRLAWTLGVEGHPLATIETPRGGLSSREAVELELAPWSDGAALGATRNELVVILDDAAALDDSAREAVRRVAREGARIVVIGSVDLAEEFTTKVPLEFAVPPLDPRTADELVSRAMPSLSDALRTHLVAKSEARPGPLRSFIKRLAGRAVVSIDEVDALLATDSGAAPPPSMNRRDGFAKVESLLDMGRFDDATRELDQLLPPATSDEEVKTAIARARVAYGRGEAAEGLAVLDAVVGQASNSSLLRAWQVTRARAGLRAGRYKDAEDMAAPVIAARRDDAFCSDALSIRGLALVYEGKDELAKADLTRAVDVARSVGDRRVLAIALCSLAIAQQRSGQNVEARATYEKALTEAEGARDAATMATIRLNLSNLAQFDGDLALALAHLEAAVDMGRRAGALVAVQGALMNLASVDIYLGRYARASASVESLVAQKAQLSSAFRADLLGHQADLAARAGDMTRAASLYRECADARSALGRPLDAAEARLEGILAKTRQPGVKAAELARELELVRLEVDGKGFLEHEALANIVRGAIALLANDDATAKTALDQALEDAQKAGRREWAWRALDARARLATSQGNSLLARRDIENALAMLEETAAKLPRDLREVFWDDPRRRALRQAHFATIPASSAMPRTNRAIVQPAVSSERGSTTLLGQARLPEDRLALIFEITRELASEHDLSRLLVKVTDYAIAMLGAERGFVVLANERGELSAHAARGRKGDEPHESFSRSVAETVVRTGEPVIASSARDDARLAQAVSVHQLMIQSVACVPIRGSPPAGHTIGALYLETRLRPAKHFDAELPTLAAFADQAAIAIESARLLAENESRREALAKVNLELEQARDKLAEILGRRTEQLTAARRDLKQVRAELRGKFGYGGLVGTSAAMRKLYALIDRVKDTDIPVLVTGESGTGKEVVARAIHETGPRAKKAFLGVNCGAIPANLLESELFGHMRGAFTGAERDRKGLFREAEGGTLLLDEIGDLPTKMQVGLLRTLQERTVRPIGGAGELPVDVRVIAATNRDLAKMVEEGTFREDLFYRLHIIQAKIPPLRERAEDIPPLIDHFLTLFSSRYRRDRKTVGREALRRLCSYEWPGNVRQLEHVLLNAWLLSEESEVTVDDLQLPTTSSRPPSTKSSLARDGQSETIARSSTEFKDSERERILAALSSSNWNRVRAAKILGVPRRTFYRRLKEYGIL